MSFAKKEDIDLFLRRTMATLTENPLLEQQLEDDQLIQEVGINSIKIVNLIVHIELNFDIVFEDEELLTENFTTLRVISEQIKKKLGVAS